MMEPVGVIAVMGACAPERGHYAARLAQNTGSALLAARQWEGSPEPAHEAAVLASWVDTDSAVVEFPAHTSPTELIGAFAGAGTRAYLRELVCVADALHLLADLHREDYATVRDSDSGVATEFVARALLTAMQLEYASSIVLVNWSALEPRDLAVVMALVNHLAPRARLRAYRGVAEHGDADVAYDLAQDGAGWLCVLNGECDPYMTEARVSAFRYEQIRPLHPGRLKHFLDRVERRDFGAVVRSAGFCRLATRPGIAGGWDHVGRVISLNPLATDDGLGDGELLALGQELAFIGIDLNRAALSAALDAAALSDAELAAGPAAWASFPDPFPAWLRASDRSE